MLNFMLIGNLGADAVVKETNGRQYVSFRVAHSEKVVDRQTGSISERTEWISCTLDGNGGGLLQYLKRGVKVFVMGAGRLKTFRSSKDGLTYAGIDVFVRQLELCGGPRQETNEQQKDVPF